MSPVSGNASVIVGVFEVLYKTLAIGILVIVAVGVDQRIRRVRS